MPKPVKKEKRTLNEMNSLYEDVRKVRRWLKGDRCSCGGELVKHGTRCIECLVAEAEFNRECRGKD